MSTSQGKGVETNGIGAKQTGHLGASESPPSSADPRQSCGSLTKPGCPIPGLRR
jgi:hypothetical protein